MSQAGIFVVGTDTEVGKTYQSTLLLRELAKTRRVGVYKPVASGGDEALGSDPTLLNEATGQNWPMERVCPQWFEAPVAPPIAAELEGRKIDERLLVQGARWWVDRCDFLLVEGAGGVMSPISHSWTVINLAQELELPVVLVAANRLGVVNHCLLSLEALMARNLHVVGVVLNQLPGVSDLSQATNRNLLQAFTDLPVVDSIVDLASGL